MKSWWTPQKSNIDDVFSFSDGPFIASSSTALLQVTIPFADMLEEGISSCDEFGENETPTEAPRGARQDYSVSNNTAAAPMTPDGGKLHGSARNEP
jgi:hypothetical protein